MTARRLLPALLLPLLLLTAGACGGEDDPAARDDSGAAYNDADVAFATSMIPHHAQALAMVEMTQGRELDPELAALTEQVRDAQAPEIETMADWLTAWGEPVPDTMRDHAHADDDMGMADSDMPGMMTGEELDELEAAPGDSFEQMWLAMMIEHHEGAIEMAEQEIEDGKFPGAIDLAESIIESQQAEIDQMEQMLGS